jgi:hypothetical protein
MKKLPKPEFQLGEEVWSVVFGSESVLLRKDLIEEIIFKGFPAKKSGIDCEYIIYGTSLFPSKTSSHYIYKLNKKNDAIKKAKKLIHLNIERLESLIKQHKSLEKEL